MSLKLKIIIIVIIVCLLIYMISKIKAKKLSIRHALIWIIAELFAVFCIVFVEDILKISNIIGIETVSNMMFFIGFVFLVILCFNMSVQLTEYNKKIVSLTQELGILKNLVEKGKNDEKE